LLSHDAIVPAAHRSRHSGLTGVLNTIPNEAVGEIGRRLVQHGTKHARKASAKSNADVAQPVMMTAHAFARRVVTRTGGCGDVITPSVATALLKSALRRGGRSDGCKRHAENPSLVRHQQFFWSKSSSVQHSKTHALVTWWLLPAAKTSLASPISQRHPYAL
jgi:hypothetical protein